MSVVTDDKNMDTDTPEQAGVLQFNSLVSSVGSFFYSTLLFDNSVSC